MDENKNSNRGTFPGNNIPEQGSIQTTAPAQVAQETTNVQGGDSEVEATPNLSHHETTENELTEGSNTFLRLETKNAESQVSGIIEVDLISFRERGHESRFLSVNTTGSDKDGNPSNTSINIDNEADFNKLKEFVSQLNWND